MDGKPHSALSSDVCLRDRAGKGFVVEDREWSNLPDDLVERILRPLPLASKLNCTSVCKSWNASISADRLLSYTTNALPDGGSLFLLCTRGASACGLDPFTGVWQKLFKPECPGASIVAAGGGLMCVGNQVSECRVLCVCNPWTKVSKQLPKMPRVGLIHKVSMAVDDSTNAYVILVTGEDGSKFRGRHEYRLHTEVYDSISCSWLAAGDALPEAKFGSDPGVWWNGLFYCITELPYGLTAFDMAKGLWIELPVEMPEGITSPSLVSCRDQLLFVSLCSNPSLQTPSTTLRIWSFCDGKTLELFSQMPEALCTGFTSHFTARTPLICSGVGDMVCITSHRSPATVVYNIRNRTWKSVAPDPLFPKLRDSHLLGFLLQRQFDCVP